MLKSFQIRNFRLFRHLEVGRLGGVNLFAGKNNTGKSAFLEAVELYASNASPTILLDLVESRHETWFSEAQPHPKNFLDHPVRHLFFDHKLPRIGEEGITLGEVLSSTKLHIGVAAYQSKYNDEGAMKRIRISDAELDEDLRVSGVAFVEDISKGRGSDNRIPLMKIKGIDEPLPLKSMGDGITRLFHIIVALVNARNGLLLIDEFENGLHWSVQPKVWDIVFHLSKRLNVQVFATTHSRDCIEGFDLAWNHHPSLGAFFRLEAKDNLVKVIEYTSETLTDAIDMDVEVR